MGKIKKLPNHQPEKHVVFSPVEVDHSPNGHGPISASTDEASRASWRWTFSRMDVFKVVPPPQVMIYKPH